MLSLDEIFSGLWKESTSIKLKKNSTELVNEKGEIYFKNDNIWVFLHTLVKSKPVTETKHRKRKKYSRMDFAV